MTTTTTALVPAVGKLPVIEVLPPRDPSGSGGDLLHACAAAFVYGTHHDDTPPGAREKGHARHAHLCRILNGMDVSISNALAPNEHREMLRNMDLDDVPVGKPWVGEIAIAIDPTNMTARILGYDIGRQYDHESLRANGVEPLRPTEMPMTLDAAYLDPLRVKYLDHKGNHDPTLLPAKEARQMRRGLLGLMLITGATEGDVAHMHWRDDGTHWIDGWHTLTMGDLLADAAELEADLVKVQQGRALLADGIAVPANPGIHCRWCPAIRSCPEAARTWALATAEPVNGSRPFLARFAELLTTDRRAAHELLRFAKKVIGEAEALEIGNVKEFGPIPTRDGWEFGVPASGRTQIKGDVAYQVMANKFGQDAALGAMDMKTTQKAIKAAARAAKLPIQKTVAEIMDGIAKAGGLAKTTPTKPTEHRIGATDDDGEE